MTTVVATLTQPLIEALGREGVEVEPLIARAGLVREDLDRLDARVDYHAFMRLWELAPQASRDTSLGLHVAERHVGAATFFVAGFAARQCATLGEAVAHIGRYSRLMNENTEIALDQRGSVGEIIDGPRDGLPAWPRHYAEMALGSFMVLSRRWTGLAITPVEAAFQHPAPADTSELSRVFGCPLRFGQPKNRLVLPGTALDAPLLDADPKLRAYLDQRALELLHSLGTGTSLVDRVRRRVGEMLAGGPPPIGRTARALGMSVRTLQRRLGEEGHSYADIVDSARRTVALAALRQPRTTVAEAAFLIGYQDEKAFRRAFLRWTGDTPRAYRARAAEEGTAG